MLLTISTTYSDATSPATDLGFLLHKHPSRVQAFDVSVGTAHVFYPEATPRRCTAALLLEVDPVGLVRRRPGQAAGGFSLGQYVNDRPYAASSMMAVALARVFKSAMAGRCEARPDLASRPIPLELHVPALPCRGGTSLAQRLFEPLAWQVRARPIPLDETRPAWGDSPYVDLALSGELRLADALNHLYVLLPVLDDAKHYWVSPDEVDKLIRAGSGWLAHHQERDLITRRYLAHRSKLVESAVARLAEVDDAEPETLDSAVAGPEVGDWPQAAGVREPDGPSQQNIIVESELAAPDGEESCDQPQPLAEQRRGAVLAVLRSAGARRVADLGCGDGALLGRLLADPTFTQITAMDVSARALGIAARRLRLDRLPDAQRRRLTLFQSSLTYRDERLAGFDAAVLMEVIEHIDPPRLAALERCVFADAAPDTVVITTPNAEYNVKFENLPPSGFRHPDHRFEWTRDEFRAWAERTAARHGYTVYFVPVGAVDHVAGPPSQLAAFTRQKPRRAARAEAV